MTTTAKIETESAEIYYAYEGPGPLLLTIAGAAGAASRYAGISNILKDEYTPEVYYIDGVNYPANVGSAHYDLGRPWEWDVSGRYSF
jgi:hypothetical protein